MSLLNGHVRFSNSHLNGLREEDADIRLRGLRESDAGIKLAGLGMIRNLVGFKAPTIAVIAAGTVITAGAGALAYANYAAMASVRSTALKVILGVGGTLFALAGLHTLLGTILGATVANEVFNPPAADPSDGMI